MRNLVALALLSSVSVSAQELVNPATYVGNIYGTVLDQTGSPISGAAVMVVDEKGAAICSATTDGAGAFLINSIPAPWDGSDLSIRVAHRTYAPASIEAHVLPGAVMALEASFRLGSRHSSGSSRYRHERELEEKASRSRQQSDEAFRHTVFATREGLVGGTTANGHIIVTNDRFAALPSRRALSTNFGYERQVRITVNGRQTTVPIWDVGPWNTTDDYWNPPSIRQSFADLPRGKPEAEAAFLEGYNGGLDSRGRVVRNPAGIDLADGTFWIDLALTNNAWVDVEYLWVTPEDVPVRRRAAGK